MKLQSFVACALALLPSLTAALAELTEFAADYSYTPATLTAADVQRQLGPRLSRQAVIYAQNDPRFENATMRWQVYNPPSISVVVQPGIEADIPHIVRYANRKSIPFLTVNTGHGSTISLGKFKGIQIYMNPLNKITISRDKKSALFQGGVYGQQIISYLWGKGYVAMTGSCGCVGLVGPGLGGGHGRYQGLYGLISDGFIKLNVVLADGTPIVVSDRSHADLFWGMKGAGHNFGIVTSVEAKIYPKVIDSFYAVSYIYTQDKLEQVFEELNKLGANGTQPQRLNHYGLYSLAPAISPNQPVIIMSFDYIGSQAEATPFLTGFENIGAVFKQDGNVPYPQLPHAEGSGVEDAPCNKGLTRIQYNANTQMYNVTAQRKVYELYASKIYQHPGLAETAVVMEGYATKGVTDKDPKDSAYAIRDEYIMMGINIWYKPNSTLDAFANDWGKQTAKLWNEGQPGRKPTTYINYAFGDEPIEQIYGHEPWRLERLRRLKKRYDPKGKFNYYNPIPLYGRDGIDWN
ncbi:FAD binding domain-containing protein [Amylocarpus encephaloides]|uniref:FAD binding domain-containing protein n=1 Tax=Amylocarpus encephaloides TaxID=45428 RepID=A0A9P8C2T1_9HELO|nr:FAD binding domain-containing protein [Amylocarpus encephaloides]